MTRPLTPGVVAALVLACAVLVPALAAAQVQEVTVERDERGFWLAVDGEPIMVYGMNYSHVPIGENYAWDFWGQSDEFIEEALRRDMTLLRNMGANAIRTFGAIPPRWIEYIYDNYGIYTALNPLLGRYGYNIDGRWVPEISYADPTHRAAILADLEDMVETYRDTRGVLMWLLGNENNYGLHWTSFEIEALPGEEYNVAAEHLYSFIGEAAEIIQAGDGRRPVATTNGDLQYADLLAEHCDAVDIFGANVYRGESMGDLYQRALDELDRPVVFTEFGADAYDALRQREDDVAQAHYLHAQWQEIYENALGRGVGNAMGGFVFQWSDGWWKTGQEDDLDVHNPSATWPNGGYWRDYVEGENNMNEEWFGITAKNPTEPDGQFTVEPRTAYYVLQEAWRLDPFAPSTTIEAVRAHFAGIAPENFAYRYQGARAASDVRRLQMFQISEFRVIMDSSVTRGTSETERGPDAEFDHSQTLYVGAAFDSGHGVRADATLSVVGNVAQNRLDPLRWELGSLEPEADALARANGDADAADRRVTDRVRLYGAEFVIERPLVELRGLYRRGHYHWGYEGDFFGLYREAYYGPNIDIYDAAAPNLIEGELREGGEGFAFAIGPQMWWGANPGAIARYGRTHGRLSWTVVHHEDFTGTTETESTFAVPEQRSRATALALELGIGSHTLEVGGLMAGSPLVGEDFIWVQETSGRGYVDSGYDVIEDEVLLSDTLGGRARMTFDFGKVRWYAQGGYQGLVANGGPDAVTTITGWTVKQPGRGNHVAGLTGFAVDVGTVQIAPNAMYVVPLIGPNPVIGSYYSPTTGIFYPGVRPRNVIDDPFAVLDNRETIALEMLLTYDPTPGTWFYAWDRNDREDAVFAANLDLTYRIQPTSRDANLFTLANGAVVPFGGEPAAQDVWDAKMLWFSRITSRLRLSGELFGGQQLANGDSQRRIDRFGGMFRVAVDTMLLEVSARANDWGPYDYHRDFNLTYPLQVYGDWSWGVGRPVGDLLTTRFGVRGQIRTLDEHSPGFAVASDVEGDELVIDPGLSGTEYEVGFYVQVGQ